MLGLLGASMTFVGVYRYASAAELEAAVAELSELLDAEDDDTLAAGFDRALRRRGIELRLDLEATGPRDWYLAYEALVETLGTHAASGAVDGTIEGVAKSYPAGPPAPRRVGTEPIVRHATDRSGSAP